MTKSLIAAALSAAAFAALPAGFARAEPPQPLPTPAELAEQMKQQAAEEEARPKIAYFDFDFGLGEKEGARGLFGDPAPSLRQLIDRMRMARFDDEVQGVLITFKPGGGLNFAQAQEIRTQIEMLREAGKPVFVYADGYNTITYMVAAAADNVALLGAGEIFIPGINIETMFYKGMFDKVGVTPDYIQVGEFKGADEPYTRTEPSEELAKELDGLAGALYGQIVDAIAESRGVSRETVRKMIDEAGIFGDEALEAGFVDQLIDADGVRPMIAEVIGEEADELNLIRDYGAPEEEEIDFGNPLAILAGLSKREPPTDAPKVALLYAVGTIVDGEGGDGPAIPLLGGGTSIGSETIRRAMREIERDENIKAVVIRIDSPGGSALASEAMWQAVRRVSEEKPVIISVGGIAASGGYYLLSAGDYAYADPAAIVGSIGVVGGKLVLSDLYDKLGLTTARFTRGANADLFSDTSTWTEAQQKLIRRSMKRTYDQFIDRIEQTRGDKIEDIDQIARGRIFLAEDALELGMVDELGGIEDAIAHAAGAAGFTDTNYEIKVVPEPVFDPGSLFGGIIHTPIDPATATIWSLLPESRRTLIGHQIQMGQLLSDRPVVLMAPFVVTPN
jgi:protease-4